MSVERLADWGGGVVETLSWSTSVALSRDGSTEERRSVRPTPHREIRFGAHVDASLDLEIHADWGGDSVRWLPGATYPAETGSGLTQIDLTVAPHLLGFEQDRDALVVSADGTTQQTTVTGIVIAGTPSILVSPAVDVVDGDYLVPLIDARLASSFEVARSSPTRRAGEVVYIQTSSARHDAPGGVDEFDLSTSLDPDIETIEPESGAAEIEVFWRRPSGQGEGYSRRVEEVNPGLGARSFVDVDSITRVGFTHDHALLSRQDAWSFRRFLYRRRGRLDPCFVPAGHWIEFLGTRHDSGTDFWAIVDHGWASTVPDSRFAIVLHLADGTRSYHTIGEIADSSHATLPVPAGEAWILNPYPAVTSYDADDVIGVDWLVYARLATDTISIAWASSTTARASLEWAPVPWPSEWEAA